jgi:putative DNA primase/helicase
MKTEAVQLTEAELADLVISAVETFRYGDGPYLEREHRAVARKLGYNEERIERLWRNAADEACEQLAGMQARLSVFGRFDALRPKIDEAKRKLAEPEPMRRFSGPVLFLVPAIQPPAEEKPKDTPKEERVEEPPQALVPLGFAPLGSNEVVDLDPAAPFDNAQKIVTLRAWHPEEGIRTWQYWQQSFWQWVGLCWREVDDDTVRSSIWHQLNVAEKIVKRGRRERFEPTPKDVNATIDALKAATNLPTKGNPMPGWLGSEIDEDVRELVACQNGILHMPTRKLRAHSPRFWSPNVLDFAYNPRAHAPRFKQFLEEIWPGEPQTQQCLLEMFGLCLTDITKYQKAFMFVGPKRGGRGTIGRVLRGLIGPDNYIGTSLKAFSEQFGMENFIGKKVAVFSDARLDGVLQRNLSTMTERLLMITGEDEMHINRKNTKYWNGNLATKVVTFSNELLRFQDESGALASRFLTFRMQQSFYGREDEDLTDKLLAERPGILNLAIEALDELRARGKLIQSDAGKEMSERLGELTSDVKVFIEECCDVGPKFEVPISKIFQRWQYWCSQHNIRHGWGDSQFSEKLRSVVPALNSGRPRKNNPKRHTVLYGIGLRPREDV